MTEPTQAGFVEEINGIANTLNDAAREIVGIARGFHLTGNRDLSERLWMLSDEISSASSRARDALFWKVSADATAATQATNNLLTAITAGVKIGQKQP